MTPQDFIILTTINAVVFLCGVGFGRASKGRRRVNGAKLQPIQWTQSDGITDPRTLADYAKSRRIV